MHLHRTGGTEGEGGGPRGITPLAAIFVMDHPSRWAEECTYAALWGLREGESRVACTGRPKVYGIYEWVLHE